MKRSVVVYMVAVVGGAAGGPIGCGHSSPGGTPDAAVDAGVDDAGVDAPPQPAPKGRVITVVGTGDAGYVDGARVNVRLSNPANVEVGPDGKVYVADFDNAKIRVVDPETGMTATLFDLPGFQRPFGMAVAPPATLYVSTDRNPQGQQGPMTGTIWAVDLLTGMAAPLVENIGRPRGLAVLADGRIAATDYQHHVVELIDPVSRSVQIIAGAWDQVGRTDGTGEEARFANPYDVVVLGDDLIVADRANHQLRRIALDGTVTTLAGTGTPGYTDGPAATAAFNRPQGLAVAANGDLFITDLDNYRVRRLAGGTVTTIAGDGTGGHMDSEERLAAQLYGMEGIAAVGDGSVLYVADGARGEPLPYHRLRAVELP